MNSENSIGKGWVQENGQWRLTEQEYPRFVRFYKDERRLLINASISTVEGLRTYSDFTRIITDMDDFSLIGETVIEALEFIEKSPVSPKKQEELKKTDFWEITSEYKSKRHFFENNDCAYLSIRGDGLITIAPIKKINKDTEYFGSFYSSCFFELPTAEKIGRTVMKSFSSLDEYYSKNPIDEECDNGYSIIEKRFIRNKDNTATGWVLGDDGQRRLSKQQHPRTINIYKGEGRILVNASINHRGGYYTVSDFIRVITDIENFFSVGKAIIEALEFIETCPVCRKNREELEQTSPWKQASKYKSYKSFCKNNNCADFSLKKDGTITISSLKKISKYKGYNGCIKRINFLELPTAEEIGKAVVDVLQAADEYYAENPME